MREPLATPVWQLCRALTVPHACDPRFSRVWHHHVSAHTATSCAMMGSPHRRHQHAPCNDCTHPVLHSHASQHMIQNVIHRSSRPQKRRSQLAKLASQAPNPACTPLPLLTSMGDDGCSSGHPHLRDHDERKRDTICTLRTATQAPPSIRGSAPGSTTHAACMLHSLKP